MHQSSRAAHAFERFGIKKGDRVLVLLPRIPEWWEAMLGLMKLGAVSIPCTTLLTPQDIQYRAAVAGAVGLITDGAGAEKLAQVRAQCPTIQRVIHVDEPGAECPDGCVGYHPAVDIASPVWYGTRTTHGDPSLIYFTSGTACGPTMTTHTHASCPSGTRRVAGRSWLDLAPDDLQGHLAETRWANYLDWYFDTLAPAPYHWCLLQTATPPPAETEYLAEADPPAAPAQGQG